MLLKTASLSDDILAIIKDKHTERPRTGELNETKLPGTYLCRQCGLALFRADSKFASSCGWPSFDAEIANHVKEISDDDGVRTEIVCARCAAHLGHVFRGEGFTLKNVRHCVNSLSLDFVPIQNVNDTEEAIFAAGCFWGVEFYLKKIEGVLKTEVGYIGGDRKSPSYEQICTGDTGHYEAIRVIFDPSIVSYETLTRAFFEIHDPTQSDGQGPDRGSQYLSAIFYYDPQQKQTAVNLIKQLERKGLTVRTQILPVQVFWRAEKYHQDYYQKTGKTPYCHFYTKRF
ncbi:MAG: bifunctional methionine sulfoxide reductase B/A protein [Gammaproteobacteria bacterium]|nr:bifunctional methionine sulfoxide reductase B/A protein [Gammaproteobacteria bacterium]